MAAWTSQILNRRLLGEFDRNSDKVTVGDGNTITVRTDASGNGNHVMPFAKSPRIFCVSCCIFSSSATYR